MNRRDLKTVLITGSTDGIGRQAAVDLAAKGLRVLIHGRDPGRAEDTAQMVRKASGRDDVDFYVADFRVLSQVRGMVEEVNRKHEGLDVLINNAGVFRTERSLTPDGFEETFAVNHLAHFLLTWRLLDLLRKRPGARIVNVSSISHSSSLDFDNLQGEREYSGHTAYEYSKLENMLFTYELAERLKGDDITANCLDPGTVSTKLLHAGWGMAGAPVQVGSDNVCHVALSPKLKGVTGKYFVNQQITRPPAVSHDAAVRDKLWRLSEELCSY